MNGVARNYHLRTSYERNDMGGGRLDRGEQPEPFKSYTGLERILLPQALTARSELLSEVLDDNRPAESKAELDVRRLAGILSLTHALTGQARYGSEVFYFRSVASAGALYPFELYVAVGGVAGIDDGIYHHDVRDQGLTKLRSGGGWQGWAETLQREGDATTVLMFFLTSIFFRSSWKYRDRAYRYHLLDTGHLAENLILALKSERLAFQVHYDFDDTAANDLLGVDPEREGCLAVVSVSGGCPLPRSCSSVQSAANKKLAASSMVSSREVEYPAIREIHAASSRICVAHEEVEMISALGVTVQESVPAPRPERWPEAVTYREAVGIRRSRRDFAPAKLPADQFGSLLAALCSGSRSKMESRPAGVDAIVAGLATGRVAGLAPGFYLLDWRKGNLGLVISKQSLMGEMARACLGQTWLADCALSFLFLCNLELLERTWGPRGYRYAMLTAGRLGQRLYVASTSLGLGCCGIGAFYDRECASLLGIGEHASLLYLVAVGPVRRQFIP